MFVSKRCTSGCAIVRFVERFIGLLVLTLFLVLPIINFADQTPPPRTLAKAAYASATKGKENLQSNTGVSQTGIQGAEEISSGQLSLSKEILSLSAGGSFNLNVGINYSNSSVYEVTRVKNSNAPTGILGLGWYYTIENIFVNHNSTTDISDDEWYYQDDMGAVHDVIMKASDKGYIKDLINFRIDYKLVNGRISGWRIITPDGVVKIFGKYESSDDENAVYITTDSGGVVGVKNCLNKPAKYYDKWLIKRIVNYTGKQQFNFEYGVTFEAVKWGENAADTIWCTKASYINEITSSSEQRMTFTYLEKDTFEFSDPTPVGVCSEQNCIEKSDPQSGVFDMEYVDEFMDRYETKYLDKITLYNDVTFLGKVQFEYNQDTGSYLNVSGNLENMNQYKKRVLTRIRQMDVLGNDLVPPTVIKYVDGFTGDGIIGGLKGNPDAGFGSIRSITDANGKEIYYSYKRTPDVYNVYKDTSLSDSGNITDLEGINSFRFDRRSQMISGSGYLVVNEFTANHWMPHFYSLLQDGYKKIDEYYAFDGTFADLPDSLNRRSRIEVSGDRMIIYKLNSLEKYDVSIYKYVKNDFYLDFIEYNVKPKTQYFVNNCYLLIKRPDTTDQTWPTSSLSLYVYEADATPGSRWNSVGSSWNVGSNSQVMLGDNAVFELRNRKVYLYDIDPSRFHDGLAFSEKDSICPSNGAYSMQPIKNGIAIRTLISSDNRFSYDFYILSGHSYLRKYYLGMYDSLSHSGELFGKGQIIIGDEWIGVYQNSDDAGDSNRIWFITHGGRDQKAYWTDYNDKSNGFFIGNKFIKLVNNYSDYLEVEEISLSPREDSSFSGGYLKGVKWSLQDPTRQKEILGVSRGELDHNSRVTAYNNTFDFMKSSRGYNSWQNNVIGESGEADANNWTQYIDINGDGLLDQVFRFTYDYQPWVICYNNGDGTWKSRQLLISEETGGKRYIACGRQDYENAQFVDINGDGLLDYVECLDPESFGPDMDSLSLDGRRILTGNVYCVRYGGTIYSCIKNKLVVFYNLGNTWSAPVEIMGRDENLESIQFQDIQRDGLLDIVFQDAGTVPHEWYYFLNYGSNTWVDGRYNAFNYGDTGSSGNGAQFRDFNSDGLVDYVSRINGANPYWRIVINNGTNSWQKTWNVYTNGYTPTGTVKDNYVKFVDINGDGLLDYVEMYNNPSYPETYKKWHVLYNNGVDKPWIEGNLLFDDLMVDGNDTARAEERYEQNNYVTFNTCARYQDVNSDGLTDFIYRNTEANLGIHFPPYIFINTSGAWRILYNMGNNNWDTDSSLDFQSHLQADHPNYAQFYDINSDGLTDLVYRDSLNGSQWETEINTNSYNFIHYRNLYNNKSIFRNLSSDLIDSVIVKQSEQTKTAASFFYKDTSITENDPAIPDNYEGFNNYFTIDYSSNAPRNIKSLSKSMNGSYAISKSYGHEMRFENGTGLERMDTTFTDYYGNTHQIDRSKLTGMVYEVSNYTNDDILFNRVQNLWEAYRTSEYPKDFYQRRILKTINYQNMMPASDVYFIYNDSGLIKETKTIPLGTASGEKPILSHSIYAYENTPEMGDLDLNILNPVEISYSFVDINANNYYNNGERIINYTSNIWYNDVNGLTYWNMAKQLVNYYEKPDSDGVTYQLLTDLSWDENGNMIKQAAQRKIASSDEKRQVTNTVYTIDGRLPIATISNADKELVFLGIFDECYDHVMVNNGWSQANYVNFGFENGGYLAMSDGASFINYARQIYYDSCMVEFDAICENEVQPGIIRVNILDGQTTVKTEIYDLPINMNRMGEVVHFTRKVKARGNNISIELTSGVWIDNIMVYPEYADINIMNYDKNTFQLASIVSSAKRKSFNIFDVNHSPFAKADIKGNISGLSHTFFSRELNNDVYNPSSPNMIEEVSFINGNLIPYWSFEEKGDTATGNTVPYWDQYWTSNITITGEKCFYGNKSLKVIPQSDSMNDGVLVDFIASKLNPQYSSILGKDVTLSFWIFPVGTGTRSIRVGMDCVEYGDHEVSCGKWNYVTQTIHNVLSRYASQTDSLTPRHRVFIKETITDQNLTFYIDGAVLELGDKANHPVVTLKLYDAVGALLQTHQRKYDKDGDIYDGGDSITVVFNEYDNLQRLIKTSLPFNLPFNGSYTLTGSPTPNDIVIRLFNQDSLELKALNSYGTANNPFYRYSYLNDGTDRLSRKSLPGKAFNIDSGIYTQNEYKKASSIRSGNTFTVTSATGSNDGKFTWNYSTAPQQDGLTTYSHSIKDWRGKTVLAYSTKNGWSMGTNNTNLLSISHYEYDLVGNLIKEYSPSAFTSVTDKTKCSNVLRDTVGSVTSYSYDSFGRNLKRTSTDLDNSGVEYRYDAFGRLRFVRDANHLGKGNMFFLVYKYDAKGRLSRILDVMADGANDSVHFNDKDLVNKPDYPTNPANIINVLQENEYDMLGRLSTTRSYSYATREPVVVVYQYDGDNNVAAILEKIPDFRTNVHKYTYTPGGLVKSYEFMDNTHPEHFVREMEYDNTGKLTRVISGNDTTINYMYNDPRGLITHAQTPIYSHSNTYDVQGKLIYADVTKNNQDNPLLFQEDIAYEEPYFNNSLDTTLIPQYNGNISGIRYFKTYLETNNEVYKYTYDPLGRLNETYYKRIDDSDHNNQYSSSYAYLPDGNINTVFKKVFLEPDSIRTDTGAYEYDGNSHRLQTLNGRLRTTGAELFEYDANGNMTYDKAKKMRIDYDWRNMPIRFKMFDAADTTKPKYVVQMVYDASGNRVAKMDFNRN